MNKLLLEHIVCPTCRKQKWTAKQLNKDDAILLCKACKSWYLSEENILELVQEELNKTRKISFFTKHEKKLQAMKVTAPKREKSEGEEVAQKEAQMHFFDKFSGEYVLETQCFWKAYYSMFFDNIISKIPKRSLIIDVGCGTGLGSMPFLNNDYTVIGIDLSREMIKKAVAKIPRNVKDRHHFLVADAEHLPFKKETFDAGIGLGILHHVHDVHKMGKSVTKCLKKNGRYFGHENNKSVLRPVFDVLMKIYTLWHEEAGEEQLLNKKDVQKIFAQCKVQATTHVFLPPHVLNWFNMKTAKKLLVATDSIAAKVPFAKNNGGTIIFEAQKQSTR